MTPPAMTSEMALARNAGCETSAAARRKYQKKAACMPCSTVATHSKGKLRSYIATAPTMPDATPSSAPSEKPARRPITAISSEAGMVVPMMPRWTRKIGTVANHLWSASRSM